jgi:hypothetical protein
MVFWSSPAGGARAPRSGRLALPLLAVLACATSGPVSAEITPEAKKVVERHIEVIGGRAAFDAVESVRGKGELQAFGFTGTIETWTRRPDRRASRMEIGPLVISQGQDGSTAWRIDPSGKVIVLDGLDLERSIASTWFDANRWLEADQGGGSVRITENVKGAEGYDVLDVRAPGDDSRQVWVHRETGLIDRVIAVSDQRTVISELSDYRTFAGVKFAVASTTSVEGMPANDLRVKFDTLEVNGDMSAAPFGVPGEGDTGVRYLKTPGLARLGFDYTGKHLWVRASVNGGPPADFIYDTGASITVIDSAYAAQIGLETMGHLQGQGAGATGNVSLATLDRLEVSGADGDGIAMTDVAVAVLSINAMLEPFFWKPCAGIIGFNFITQFVNEIDYETGVIMLHDPKTFTYQGGGAAIPMSLAGTIPAITMTIDGRYKGEFRVDVGSSATVDLHRPFVETHGIAKTVKKSVDVTSGGFGGTFISRVTRMQSIAIGPFEWKKPLISLSQAETGALASADYAGNIGNRILERFKCTFDYERRVLHLEPTRRMSEPDEFTRTGLQITRKDGVTSAAQVIDRSPAAQAGFRVGDEIRAIDGRPAADWTRAEVETLFEKSPPGRKVPFEVSSGGAVKTIVITLADFI